LLIDTASLICLKINYVRIFILINISMYISYWPNNIALNGELPYSALLDSFSDQGHTLVKESLTADAAAIWSILWNGRMLPNLQVWNHYRQQNKPVIVTEVGGIDRGVTWKVGINGINRDAYFGDGNSTNDRALKLGLSTKKWRTDGKYILICGQHNKSLQWQGMPSMSNWFLQTYDEIRKHTDRPIIFRPHPRCRLEHIERGLKHVYRQNPQHVTGTYDDFDMGFNDVWATISYSSNPGIHSIIEGVPAFVSTHSLAYDAGNDIDFLYDIEQPLTPDRAQWLNDYAWTEFTVEEIAEGLPIQRLRKALGPDIVDTVV
jgi:hypothetical protein